MVLCLLNSCFQLNYFGWPCLFSDAAETTVTSMMQLSIASRQQLESPEEMCLPRKEAASCVITVVINNNNNEVVYNNKKYQIKFQKIQPQIRNIFIILKKVNLFIMILVTT